MPADTPDAPEGGVAWEIKDGYEKIKSMRAAFDQHTKHPLIDSTETYSGVVHLLQPDRFKIEYSKPSGQFITAHADTFWFYSPENKQMMRCRGAESLDFLELVRRYIESPTTRIENGRNEIIFRVTDPDPGVQYTSMLFAFSKNDLLLRRIVLGDVTGLETSYEFKDIKIDVEIPPGFFDIIVPRGADLVDCNGEVLQGIEE